MKWKGEKFVNIRMGKYYIIEQTNLFTPNYEYIIDIN